MLIAPVVTGDYRRTSNNIGKLNKIKNSRFFNIFLISFPLTFDINARNEYVESVLQDASSELINKNISLPLIIFIFPLYLYLYFYVQDVNFIRDFAQKKILISLVDYHVSPYLSRASNLFYSQSFTC